ncbi:MAG: outer membrane beta-barrel protein [Pseudomonadales bacterium]
MIRVFIVSLLAAVLSTTAFAQSKRDQDWEVALVYKYQSAESFGAPEGADEANVAFDSSNGWGFNVGYNFNEHLNLAWEFTHSKPDYTTHFLDEDQEERTLSHTSTFISNHLVGTYHLLKGPITPYISAGLGYTNVDSNISDGSGYCVPDYYWGWYCYSSSYNKGSFSYNAAIGLRADISNTIFVRASYGRQWLDQKIGTDTPTFDIGRLEIGYRFF